MGEIKMNDSNNKKPESKKHAGQKLIPFLIFIALGLLAFFAFIMFGIGGSAFVYKDV